MGRWSGLVFIGLGIWQFFAGGQGLRKYRGISQNQSRGRKIFRGLMTFGLGAIFMLWGLVILIGH